MFFIWTQVFLKHTRKKNMRKKSGDVNPHYVQYLKLQSERVVSYNHLLTEWYYFIFLRLLFWFLVFLKTPIFWKIFSKHLPSPKWMTYLNKNSINQSTWKRCLSSYSRQLCLDLCLMFNLWYFLLNLQEIKFI